MPTKWKSSINLKQYNRDVHAAIMAVCERRGLKMQDEARQNAKWEDRTGNARGGLFSKVEDRYGRWIKIYLAHTMDYGVFLETSFGGRYAIIWPTVEANLNQLKQDLEAIFK